MKDFLCKKKGNMALETVGAIIIIAVVGIIFFLSAFITNNFNEGIQDSTAFNNESKEVIDNVTSKAAPILNNMIVFFFFVSWIMAMVAAWFSNEHPLFLVVGLIIFLMVIVGSVFLQSAVTEVIEQPEFATQYASMPLLVFLINNMLSILIVYGLSVGLMLYARYQT